MSRPGAGSGSIAGAVQKTRFFVDLVAGRLLLARSDPVDEWLQVALALSIEIFLERPPPPCGHHERPCRL
jgi:hypothetical protein